MVCLFCVLFTHNSLLQDGDLIFVEISWMSVMHEQVEAQVEAQAE